MVFDLETFRGEENCEKLPSLCPSDMEVWCYLIQWSAAKPMKLLENKRFFAVKKSNSFYYTFIVLIDREAFWAFETIRIRLLQNFTAI